MSPRLLDAARLTSLRATGLLDAETDVDLMRITTLVSDLLGVPTSLVTLIDADRQVVAAQTGMREPWAAVREVPLSHSICKHVVDRDGSLLIDDARIDPLVADSLVVRDLGIVAYAGIPLRDEAGLPLGALCAVDGKPRHWTERDVEVLTTLARVAAKLLELHSVRAGVPIRDPLTGLPGRAVFEAITDRGLQAAARANRTAALIALDINGFRLINEALGYAAGDALLQRVAELIAESLDDDDAACRVAGDEFLIFRADVTGEDDASRFALEVLERIAADPQMIQTVSASAGVAVATTPTPGVELARAARARLRAEPGMSESGAAAQARLTLRTAVAQAHRRGEMWLNYQPIVCLSTDRITGFEALLRWEHPELGFVAPDVFIPAAEETGAIVDIGEWVLQQACADLARWRSLDGCDDLHVSVNIAPVQVGLATFAQTVATTLAHAGLPASALTLEITERTLLADRQVHRDTLAQLRQHGVRVALDDFGTGYSALSYLTRFPVDDLKIDRTFIEHLEENSPSASIVEGIVAMARALGMRAVAEGIEEAEQGEVLARMGCGLGQGYHYSRPVAAAVVEAQLRELGVTALD